MKKNRKLSTLMLFASTGAIICTGSGAIAQDADVQGSRIYQTEETVEVRQDAQLDQQGAEFDAQIIDEPAGAERRTYTTQRSTTAQAQSFGTVHKASDIIGMEVRNHQNEKLGDIKDVMVDLNSGRVPFAVISPDGLDNRLIAVPPSALNARAGQQLVLDMDRQRLRSAPSFERNRWPDMASQQWSSDVYRFYGAQPYWQTGSYQGTQPYQRRSEFREESWVTEPAGAPIYHESGRLYDAFEDSNTLDDINKGSNTRGGAEDLQRFDEKANARRGFTTPKHWNEPAGAVRGSRWESKQTRYSTTAVAPRISSMGRLHRASDLIGMNVKNAQNETVGEIKDVVLDLNSGHVAYTVVSADRYLDTRNELVAVPPSLFTYGADGRTVFLNANRNVLMNAPRFQRDNWNQVSKEQFVSRVYSHYGQQPYWQAQGFRQGTQFREPSGAEFEPQQYQQNYQRQEFQQQQQFEQDPFQQDDSSLQFQQDINEPTGAELQQQEPERAISEPSGAEPQSQVVPTEESSGIEVESSETQTSAPSAGFETESSAQIAEPAGAQAELQSELQSPEEAQQEATEEETVITSEAAGARAGAAARSQDQTQQLEQHVRSALKSDPGLEAQNVQVTTESGKIVLRGSVKSETEKQQIEQKVQDAILDSQIQVESSSESED